MGFALMSTGFPELGTYSRKIETDLAHVFEQYHTVGVEMVVFLPMYQGRQDAFSRWFTVVTG